MIDEYYTPRDIIFNRDQIIWLLCNLSLLKEGTWPPNPQGSGYVDTNIITTPSRQAPFETPAQYAAEVEARLKTTRDSGESLIDELQSGIEYYDFLSRPAKRALNYITGWRRRKQTFSQWVRYHRRVIVKQK